MKKIIFFLIMIMTLILFGNNVYAEEYSFYEAEYLDNIYMSKYDYSTNIIHYQKGRLFRNKKTGKIVYCIEPLIFFNENSTYHETTSPRGLTKQQIERIEKIAYFGWQYKDHSDGSWYAVAQMMIWRESNPTGGDYYFTNTLNGERINIYDGQIAEINRLINVYDSEIPIKNKTITMVEGTTKEIEIGEVLEHYHTNNNEIELTDNKIIIKDLPVGEYNITLTREKESHYGIPIVMYESANSQNMIQRGDLEEKQISFKINVINTSIELNKLDEENNNNTPQGEADLNGAIYKLYNNDDEEIETIEIINNKGIINNIPFGNYKLKEVKAGKGYTLNDKVYEITISEQNPNIVLDVTNKVIEKEITIIKTYGDEKTKEPNINFEIINNKNEVIETISTDEEGKATITLPYGTYTIKQLNTTTGYQLLEPFIINITNNEKEEIELNDFKIPVPNTSTKVKHVLLQIIYLLAMILC